jgi:hypothetical protein
MENNKMTREVKEILLPSGKIAYQITTRDSFGNEQIINSFVKPAPMLEPDPNFNQEDAIEQLSKMGGFAVIYVPQK